MVLMRTDFNGEEKLLGGGGLQHLSPKEASCCYSNALGLWATCLQRHIDNHLLCRPRICNAIRPRSVQIRTPSPSPDFFLMYASRMFFALPACLHPPNIFEYSPPPFQIPINNPEPM